MYYVMLLNLLSVTG